MTAFEAISTGETRGDKSTVRVRSVRSVRSVRRVRSAPSVRIVRRIRSFVLVHDVIKLVKSSKQPHRGTAAILYQ